MKLTSTEDVVLHLERDVYVRIQRSPIDGVGVFAIRDIPPGIDPFQEEKLGFEFTRVPVAAILGNPLISHGVKKYTLEVCSTRDGVFKFPVTGLNSVTAMFLMNHSDAPNMRSLSNGVFETIREIKRGEELLINYGEFDDSLEMQWLKENPGP